MCLCVYESVCGVSTLCVMSPDEMYSDRSGCVILVHADELAKSASVLCYFQHLQTHDPITQDVLPKAS